jgi:fimbrial chaperone protein
MNTTANEQERTGTHRMKSWTLYCKILLAVATLLPLPASAYTASTSLVTLQTSGSGSSTFLWLENKNTKPAAVEFSINEHLKNIDGKTILGVEAGDNFIIYPAQIVMLPGDEISVQLLWVGEPVLEAEQVYTLLTREVAIPRKVDSSEAVRIDITVLLNYESRVYVTPPGARPNVVVESVAEVTQSKSADENLATDDPLMLEIILVNQGTAHLSMRNMSLVFVPLDPTGAPLTQFSVTLAAIQIPAMRPHLLAGDRRRLLIQRPDGLPPGPVGVSLSE